MKKITLASDLLDIESAIMKKLMKGKEPISIRDDYLSKREAEAIEKMLSAEAYDSFRKSMKMIGSSGDGILIVNRILESEILTHFLFLYVFDKSLNTAVEHGWLMYLMQATSPSYIVDYIKNHKDTFSVSNMDINTRRGLTYFAGPFETDDELASLLEEKLPLLQTKRPTCVVKGRNSSHISHVISKYSGGATSKNQSASSQQNKVYYVSIHSYYNFTLVNTLTREFFSFTGFSVYLNNDLSYASFDSYEDIKKYIASDPTTFNLNNIVFKNNRCSANSLPESNDESIKNGIIINESAKNELENVAAEDMILAHVSEDVDPEDTQVFYISDIHLRSRFKNANISKENIPSYLRDLVRNLTKEIDCADQDKFMVIAGDVSYEFELFELFLDTLKWFVDGCARGGNVLHVIFTLGNHELVDCVKNASDPLNETIEKYKQAIESRGFYLLQNSLIYWDGNMIPHRLYEQRLNDIEDSELIKTLCLSKVSFFGGIGFSGCHEWFNADAGIYDETVDRNREIKESRRFNDLYDKICRCSNGSKVIVVTHMPKKHWSGNNDRQKGFIYIYGHNHINKYFITSEYQVYGDNQIGYYGYAHTLPCLKYFTLNTCTDPFKLFDDGIYEITKGQYDYFLKSKNIFSQVKREFYKIYMIKKYGLYMFVSESRTGTLCILNGGAMKTLPWEKLRNNRTSTNTKSSNKATLKYFYDNLEHQVEWIENGLKNYHEYQTQVSKEVIKIGGSGKIHGCIIDIDFFDHIYINPLDGTVTYYYAPDIMSRKVYSSISDLTRDNCPNIYPKLIEFAKQNKNGIIVANKQSEDTAIAIMDYGTYLYKESRELKKLQKIYKGILCDWSTNESKSSVSKEISKASDQIEILYLPKIK